MKVTKEKESLKSMSAKELEGKVDSLRKELFTIRLNSATTHIKDYSQFKKLSRSIARALTYLTQKCSS